MQLVKTYVYSSQINRELEEHPEYVIQQIAPDEKCIWVVYNIKEPDRSLNEFMAKLP